MDLLTEELARARMSERLAEAYWARHRQQLITARRLSRKAERAAARARLALGRAI